MRRLENKVAIVTGSSRGIGAAIARRLAADGARVVVNYTQSEEAASGVAASIREAGGEALVVRADMADEAQVRQLFDKALDRFGRLDILVNNAAILEWRPFEQVDRAHFQRTFDVNVWGLMVASQEAARRFGDRGGRIINLSSIATRAAYPMLTVYSAAKGAVEAFTRVLASELGPRGITANTLIVGPVETDMTGPISEATRQGLLQQTPLRRMAQKEDIADIVSLLASEESRWITGQCIGASGGLVLT